MIKIFLTTLILLCVQSLSQGQTTDVTVTKLHEAYGKAVEEKDSVFLKDLFHNDMIVTGGNGSRRTKQEELNDLLDARYKVNFFKSRNTKIVTSGETGVVTGELVWEMVYDGKTSTLERSLHLLISGPTISGRSSRSILEGPRLNSNILY